MAAFGIAATTGLAAAEAAERRGAAVTAGRPVDWLVLLVRRAAR